LLRSSLIYFQVQLNLDFRIEAQVTIEQSRHKDLKF